MQDHDYRIILQDLIEMVVRLQAQVEDGGKKVADMEKKIDRQMQIYFAMIHNLIIFHSNQHFSHHFSHSHFLVVFPSNHYFS